MGPEGLAEANVDLRAPSTRWFGVSLVIAIVAVTRATIPNVTMDGVWLALLACIELAIRCLAPT